MRTYVFGMAKSSFDLSGAKRQKLELDVLRIIYAVQFYKYKKDNAIGYVLVYNDTVKNTVVEWINKKYNSSTDVIKVLSFSNCNNNVRSKIEKEKLNNKLGISNTIKKDSSGQYSMKITEDYLREEIIRDNNLVKEIKEKDFFSLKKEFPKNIKWDFYGIIEK